MTTLYQMLNELRVAAKGPARGELRARLRDLRGTTLDNGLKGGELVLYNGKPFWVIGSQGNKALLVSTDWAHRVKTLASKVQRKHVLWPKKLGSLGLGEALDALAVLMEADPQADADFRQEASDFIKKLRAMARDGSLLRRGGWNRDGELLIPATRVDRRYKKLMLRFTTQELARKKARVNFDVGGAFSRYNGKTVAVIDFPWLRNPHDARNLHVRMGAISFVHEFVHYLDNRRGGNFILKGPGDPGGDLDPNQPADFNAYYQEAAYEIEQLAKAIVRPPQRSTKEKKRLFKDTLMLGDRRRFVARALSRYFNPEYVTRLNRKNSQKVKTRLVGLHDFLVKKYLP